MPKKLKTYELYGHIPGCFPLTNFKFGEIQANTLKEAERLARIRVSKIDLIFDGASLKRGK